MKRSIGMALVLGTMAGVAAMQDGAKIALLAQNKEKGVEMRAPKSPGKEQMWEAKVTSDGFLKGSAAVVRHRVDAFSVEVNVVQKNADFMSDDLEASWPKPSVIAGKSRTHYTEGGDKEADYTECRLLSEDPKAKLGGLPGSAYSHRIALTDRKGNKQELIEYFVISSDILYRITVAFTKETYDKHWAVEGQYILHNIRRCKIEKK